MYSCMGSSASNKDTPVTQCVVMDYLNRWSCFASSHLRFNNNNFMFSVLCIIIQLEKPDKGKFGVKMLCLISTKQDKKLVRNFKIWSDKDQGHFQHCQHCNTPSC